MPDCPQHNILSCQVAVSPILEWWVSKLAIQLIIRATPKCMNSRTDIACIFIHVLPIFIWMMSILGQIIQFLMRNPLTMKRMRRPVEWYGEPQNHTQRSHTQYGWFYITKWALKGSLLKAWPHWTTMAIELSRTATKRRTRASGRRLILGTITLPAFSSKSSETGKHYHGKLTRPAICVNGGSATWLSPARHRFSCIDSTLICKSNQICPGEGERWGHPDFRLPHPTDWRDAPTARLKVANNRGWWWYFRHYGWSGISKLPAWIPRRRLPSAFWRTGKVFTYPFWPRSKNTGHKAEQANLVKRQPLIWWPHGRMTLIGIWQSSDFKAGIRRYRRQFIWAALRGGDSPLESGSFPRMPICSLWSKAMGCGWLMDSPRSVSEKSSSIIWKWS